jgi:hypothetical protein
LLFKTNTVFQAVTCRVTFETQGRIVLLSLHGAEGQAWVSIPEHLMADITGQFLRERLFGLH